MNNQQPSLFDAVRSPAPTASATRNTAYRSVQAEEQQSARADVSGLGERQRQVFQVIRQNTDITNMELAVWLGWTINRITPRVKELRDAGLVERGRKRKCSVTGNTVQAWKLVKMDPRHSVNPCVRVYGFGPVGKTCKTCKLMIKLQRGSRWYKCSLRNNTHSPATDHRVGWPACGKYEEE